MLQTTDYLILLGLLATLAGDALTLLPQKRMLYAIGAFFLSHLLYTLYLASQMTLTLFWPLPLVLLIVGGLTLATVWSRLEDLRWPIATFLGITLLMSWLAAELYLFRPTDNSFTLMAGALLLLLSNIIWLISHYRRRFSADSAIVAASYFAGHFLIVRSLWL